MRGRRWLSGPRASVVGTLSAVLAVGVVGFGYAAVTAADQSYTGCLQNGSISSVAVGNAPAKACAKAALQISWNQTGPAGTNGTNGVSVTSTTEDKGSNCAEGGSKFTSASGVTYACNGLAASSCDLELRIAAATPSFDVKNDCATVLAWTPSSYDFHTLSLGLLALETVTLDNAGTNPTGPLAIDLDASSEFALTGSSCNVNVGLAAGQSCTVTIRYLPTLVGHQNTLLHAKGAATKTVYMSIAGTGISLG